MDGVIIGSSDKEYIGKQGVLANFDLEKLVNNKVAITNIRAKGYFGEGIKSVIIASPIFFKNEYIGAMVNVINMSYFENIVNDVSFLKDGQIIILEKEVQFLANYVGC